LLILSSIKESGSLLSQTIDQLSVQAPKFGINSQ